MGGEGAVGKSSVVETGNDLVTQRLTAHGRLEVGWWS